MYVSIATSNRSGVSTPGESLSLDIPHGLALSYNGPSVLPDICKGDMISTIVFEPPASMALSTTCNLDLKVPDNEAIGEVEVLSESLGINHFAFKSIKIETAFSLGQSVSLTLGLTAGFEVSAILFHLFISLV